MVFFAFGFGTKSVLLKPIKNTDDGLPRMTVRNDWTREEIQAFYAPPFLDLVFQAQKVDREHFDDNTIQLSN